MILNELMTSLEIGLIYGLVAIGIYLTFRMINFPDLTCDGSFVLGAAVSAVLIKFGYHSWLALFISGMSGILAGCFTGILTIYFKITDLLAGILVAFMLYSVNLHIMDGIPNIALIGLNTVFSNTSAIILLCVVSVIICISLGYLLLTDFGLALRSIGQNKILAQNVGVHVQLMMMIGLALSNGFIAVGGALFSQYQGFADVGGGFGTVVVGLASVLIGERILPYRSIIVQIISCFIGSIIYRILIAFALHGEIFGLQTQDLNLITGLLVIGIMYLPRRQIC